ncbi:MAG: TetR/AcrR family transcriptional regulator [Nocardioides sp.]|uniref:TetR/AcrR family transcriptional regulator n=1 Tax=Nocardioides sp. TaxID=35761 RepID=UPI0039E61660
MDLKNRRRRGAELEDALLDAAWDELVAHGYAGLTIDSVAQRAGTSRPVIYRRWASKPELVRAAVDRMLRADPMTPPDTGSLRGDLLAVLRFANEHRVGVMTLLSSYLGGYFQETGTTPADLRATMLRDRPSPMDAVVDRAIERGEVDPVRATPRIRSLAFDLCRHEALMTLTQVPEEVIEEIVDDIVLPLLRG